TGAEFIVHFLEQQGIKIVTGIPGGSILPVYDALSQSTQIRHIMADEQNRSSTGAGFMFKQTQYLQLHRDVQRRSRFVGNNQ
ncbi:thiamine pyrophosphate-binding protein, partial [Escherichia coli]|uniref:thiamine pyrophosphate-binding protein n=1 Tax=Escherichia coli TaxID=562 RepID=UPI0020335264